MELEHKQTQETFALKADLNKTHEHLALMQQVAQAASSALEPTRVLEQVSDAMISALGVSCCGIYLMDAEQGVLKPHIIRESLAEVSPDNFERPLDLAVDSLISEVLQRRAPVTCYDAETDPRFSRETVQAWRVKSVLSVPIQSGEQVLGVVILGTVSEYRHFTPEEIDWVWGLANLAALAVDKARLYKETQQRLSESQGLQRVAAALLRKVGLEKVLEIVCTETQRLTGAEGSAVLLVDDGAWLRVAYRIGTIPASFERVSMEGSLAGVAVRRDEPFVSNDPSSEACSYFGQEQPTAFLAMPLHANGSVIGVLVVVDKPGGFTGDDERIASLFADQAAINIEHTRLHQQAGQLAVLEERQRLARELHDSVVQSLYSMTLYADAAALTLAAGKKDVTIKHLQELQETARGAMHNMRLLIFELHPPVLEQEGLVAALQVRLAAVETRASLQTEFLVEGERRLPVFIEQELYRIIQEALNNVMKHAKAQHVSVRLHFTDESVCMQVRDDGIGFDLFTARNTGGVGLRSIEERAAKAGGKVRWESQPGKGTTVTVSIGVEEKHEGAP